MQHPSRVTDLHSDPAVGPLPTFLVVGAPRSGTTALARYLGAHPEVFVAPEKEVRFFTENFHQGVDWYRSRFSEVRSEKAIGEATPRYMYDDRAIGRMAEIVPSASLMAILRNPVDRAYSHYWMRRAGGREDRPFHRAVEEELASDLFPSRDKRLPYLEAGRYVEWLQRVVKVFPKEALHVAVLEHLEAESVQTYRAVCEFLAVDTEFVPRDLGNRMNRFAPPRSRAIRRFARRLPSLPKRLITQLNRRAVDYPRMDPALRTDLLTYFSQDNARLESWLGRDLSVWRT